ncbi:hypothetical protein PAF15_06660 [Weissella koreensis]|uniref:hypothetical protein n=1 Tax=Weissella koreensis TaxID=165096 RepID=UPI0022BA48B4|nr:hypothetical protein [Weissella koreensis]MCZ9311620.1 hypothetical protein [Weissella koreensis]
MSKIKLKTSNAPLNNKVSLSDNVKYEKIIFNFSFLTNDKKFNIEGLEPNIHRMLLNKMVNLSIDDFINIKALPKKQGLEVIPSNSFKINPMTTNFSNTHRNEFYKDKYWVFRLSNQARVIGVMNRTIFYIFAIDTKFKMYKH